MAEFVGRSAKLQQIDKWFTDVTARRQGMMLAVRGRRQVGKSSMYTEFLRRSAAPHVFFSAAKHASVPSQLAQFARDAARSTSPIPDATTLFITAPASWNDALGRLRLAATNGPIVVVLDEFPWAAEADPALEGELQNAWDRHLQHLPALLILIGSDIAMMERLTAHDRPLFGRAREDQLEPFNPAEVAAALDSNLQPFDVFDAYLTTGGYPRLVNEFARANGLNAYIEAGLTDENSTLAVAAQRSLDAEFPADARARQVLSAIGGQEVGHPTFTSAISQLEDGSTKSGETALIRALRLLTDIKRVVVTETPSGAAPNSRLRRYRITDSYLRCWFRFVEPQLANIARGRGDLAVQAFTTGFAAWRGVAIEPIVRNAGFRLAPDLPQLAKALDIAPWWNRANTVEVDLVARGRDEVLALGTIKWRRSSPVSDREILQLGHARTVIIGASNAPLLAISPTISSDSGADLTLSASDLLSAFSA